MLHPMLKKDRVAPKGPLNVSSIVLLVIPVINQRMTSLISVTLISSLTKVICIHSVHIHISIRS